MIFTACALVAVKEGAMLVPGMEYNLFHQSILNSINKALTKAPIRNAKLNLLSEQYSLIQMNRADNQDAIDDFIDCVKQISDYVNSDNWNGEDVMGIFFNEFNRYKAKSEAGQVFTPDHITSFIYRILDVHYQDKILDATCGSGAFLVKAMSEMIKESGGRGTEESKKIMSERLYGIEFDKEIYALACANMLIHKDGKTNLEQMDTRSEEACNWIRSKQITKVLMNPPYERKYGCMKIVSNVLDNVPIGTKCAFILPDKKLEKNGGKKLLKNHHLVKIIKLPENLFFGVGVTTSIFIFEAGIPQNGQEIFACYMEDDGLETVKNQGRHDIKGKWTDIEEYWVDVIRKQRDDKYHTDQWIKPDEHLSYQVPEKPFELSEEDFIKTTMDYLMFEQGLDVKEFKDKLLTKAMYAADVEESGEKIKISFEKDENYED
jgi:type I restriction-modification system DNA methylase subunit